MPTWYRRSGPGPKSFSRAETGMGVNAAVNFAGIGSNPTVGICAGRISAVTGCAALVVAAAGAILALAFAAVLALAPALECADPDGLALETAVGGVVRARPVYVHHQAIRAGQLKYRIVLYLGHIQHHAHHVRAVLRHAHCFK